MRKLLSTLAVAAVMAVSFGQTTDQKTTAVVHNPDGSITTFMKSNNMSWEDAASAMAIARYLNMDPAMVLSQRGTVTAPFYSLAPVYVMQQQSGKPFQEIWTSYDGGSTWMQLANQYNLGATYYNPSNVDTSAWTNDDFSRNMWQVILAKNYGMTPEDFTYFTTENIPLNEVVVGEVVAREDNASIRDVMNSYNTNHDWQTVNQTLASNGTSTTTATNTMPANTQNPTTSPNPQTPANTEPQSTSDTTTTSNNNTATANRDASTSNVTAGVASPIEEWQVNGADINAYNGWTAQTSSTYGLSRKHRRHSTSRHKARRHSSRRTSHRVIE